MEYRIKAALPIAILIGTILIVGCSFNRFDDKESEENGSSKETAKTEVSSESDNLPQPTGKIDDVTSAIMDDADKEQSFDSSETDEARSEVSGSDDINSINNSYDQNAL